MPKTVIDGFLDKYEVTLYDISGERVTNTQLPNTTNCTIIYQLKESINMLKCAPFLLSARAVIPFGYSSPSNVSITPQTNYSRPSVSVCSCINENGK